MGNWNINIQGVGAHHNSSSSPTDANNMAAAFVRRLREVGHAVQYAAFTHGGAEAFVNPQHPLSASPLPQDSRTGSVDLATPIKHGDFIMHRSKGNAPYVTIGQVIEGGGGASFRIRPTMRIFAFGSSMEMHRPVDPGIDNEIVPPDECRFLYEKTSG
jgi:hypothetical protein